MYSHNISSESGYYVVAFHDDGSLNLGALPEDAQGRHTHEWHRYIIHGPDFYGAARIAAELGWWLHCWDWVEAHEYAITDREPPIPWASWLHFAGE